MSNDLGTRLRRAKESLSAWYDRLNSQWLDAEKTIQSLNLPTNVWACFEPQTQESGNPSYPRDFEHCLGYMKLDREWRICYSVGEVGDPDSHDPRPILDCSLEQRVLALEGLPKLLEAVVETAEAQSARFEVALGGAAESLASLKVRP